MANGEFSKRTGVHCRYCSGPLALGSICGCERSLFYFGNFLPKPATAEPPAWKGPQIAPLTSEQAAYLDELLAVSKYGAVTGAPDPVTAFNERRKAKREGPHPTSPEAIWVSRGHKSNWNLDACTVCGLTGMDAVSWDKVPTCDEWKSARKLAQACRLDLHQPLHNRIMPYRGKP